MYSLSEKLFHVPSTDPAKMETIPVPASRFKVSGPAFFDSYKSAVITSIGAGIILLIGISLASTHSVGSNMFWTGNTDILLGLGLAAIAIAVPYQKKKELQERMLPDCNSIDEYKAMLETDQDVQYEYLLPDYIKTRQNTDKCNLEKISIDDDGRCRLMMNGKLTDEHQKPYTSQNIPTISNPKILNYINQSTMADMLAPIDARYKLTFNEGDRIHQQDIVAVGSLFPEDPTGKCSVINLITDSSNPPKCQFLEIESNFKIQSAVDQFVKYTQGKIRIDCETGDAVVSWSSPQSERPQDF